MEGQRGHHTERGGEAGGEEAAPERVCPPGTQRGRRRSGEPPLVKEPGSGSRPRSSPKKTAQLLTLTGNFHSSTCHGPGPFPPESGTSPSRERLSVCGPRPLQISPSGSLALGRGEGVRIPPTAMTGPLGRGLSR